MSIFTSGIYKELPIIAAISVSMAFFYLAAELLPYYDYGAVVKIAAKIYYWLK